MNHSQADFESRLKKFLSEELQKEHITVDLVQEIVSAGADIAESVVDAAHEIEAFRILGEKFNEIRSLIDEMAIQERTREHKKLDAVVAQISSELVMQDLDQANQFLDTIKQDPDMNLEKLYTIYPMYREYGQWVLSSKGLI